MFNKKDLLYTSFLLYWPMCLALYKRGFEQPTSQSISKEKSRNIANIGMQSYITKLSQKCFILSLIALPCVQSTLNHLIH